MGHRTGTKSVSLLGYRTGTVSVFAGLQDRDCVCLVHSLCLPSLTKLPDIEWANSNDECSFCHQALCPDPALIIAEVTTAEVALNPTTAFLCREEQSRTWSPLRLLIGKPGS